MNVSYQIRRAVPASTRPGGPEDRHVALVLFQLPGEPVGRSLAISEEMIRAECGGDPKREDELILRELRNVLSQMTAGTSID
jgi:hypothetical protein